MFTAFPEAGVCFASPSGKSGLFGKAKAQSCINEGHVSLVSQQFRFSEGVQSTVCRMFHAKEKIIRYTFMSCGQ